MQVFALLLCFALVVLAGTTVDGSLPVTKVAHTPLGPVLGRIMSSRRGRTIYAFRGLRYAESPTGELRFKPPVPIAPWTDVLNATEEGPSCPVILSYLPSEDCLRLNVYTTALPINRTKSGKSVNPKRPVIVYIHAGAFYAFTGQSFMVGPQYIMDQDIVLVTINYRLGTLGFVSTGDALAPGNLGMKDQVVALKWVRDNIASFGGDPNCVTLVGYSAGAWSVALHMLSPMTKGLFHRGIAMSGSPIAYNRLPNHQMHLAVRQAEIVGCPTDSAARILECLKTIPATELGDSLPEFFEWRGSPVLLWSPVVEPEIPGVERYLTGQPADLIRQGKIHNVPLISGVTKNEFGGYIVSIIEEARKGNTSTIDEYNRDWYRILPIVMGYERNTSRSREISTALNQFYLKGKPITLDNIEALSRLSSDGLAFSFQRLIKLLAEHSTKPIYTYEFTYQGRYSWTVWNDTQKPYGIVHHDDLIYLFYYDRFPYFKRDDPEIPTVERMTTMWAQFAKTGNPILSSNYRFSNVTWDRFTLEGKRYLDIGNELIMKSDFRGDVIREWERIFPLSDILSDTQPKPSINKRECDRI